MTKTQRDVVQLQARAMLLETVVAKTVATVFARTGQTRAAAIRTVQESIDPWLSAGAAALLAHDPQVPQEIAAAFVQAGEAMKERFHRLLSEEE